MIPGQHGFADAAAQDSLTAENVRFFRECGFMVVRNLIGQAERASVAAETGALVERAVAGTDHEDFYYRPARGEEAPTPFRVEYILEHAPSTRVLLGHPFLLGAIEQLQGPDFIPTWDSLVFKLEGDGVAHEWHRDALPYYDPAADAAVAAIDVGIYLDDSDPTTCLWVLPGSNRWPADVADETMDRLGEGGFEPGTSVPVPVRAGDAIFHNIMTLHGSPASRSRLRRVVYFEFRQAAAELGWGPHTPEYLPLKQGMLRACLAERRASPLGRGERPFQYRAAPLDAAASLQAERSGKFLYPHDRYWRPAESFR